MPGSKELLVNWDFRSSLCEGGGSGWLVLRRPHVVFGDWSQVVVGYVETKCSHVAFLLCSQRRELKCDSDRTRNHRAPVSTKGFELHPPINAYGLSATSSPR
jgi:hypothetical protein